MRLPNIVSFTPWYNSATEIQTIIKTTHVDVINFFYFYEGELSKITPAVVKHINKHNITCNIVLASSINHQTELVKELGIDIELCNFYEWFDFFILFAYHNMHHHSNFYNNTKKYLEGYDYKFTIPYSCFNHRAKPHRVALIDQLAKQNILNKGLVSFLGAGGHGIEFKHYDGKLLTLGDNFNQDHPYIFNKQYFESFLHVATESWIEEFFLTEKTTMRLLFGLPFLTLGCKHFHKNLKDMGFVLYDEIFDYRFDDEELIDDRVDGIIKNIEYVLNSDVNELYQKIKEPLEYNRKVALEYVKGKTIPSIVKAQMAESTAKPTRTGLDFDLYSMSLYLTSLQ
jgi:hypothetical protein